MEALAQHPALAIGLVSVFGLLVGSFLNVVILRLPARMEWSWRQEAREILGQPEAYEPKPPGLVVSRSACPHCGHALAAWENIPLLSFLLLRGRCRACQAPISRQYPAVELITGLLFAACAWRFGISLELGFALAFTAALVALSGIDLRTTLLPDQIVLPLLWLGLLASLVTLFVDPVSAILGAAAGYLSLWSVTALFKLLTGKDGMGAGDFKLLAALGAWMGLKGVLPTILLSSVVGAIIGSIWLATQGRDRASPIPFGPYLAIAGWLVFMWGDQMIGGYMRLAGLQQ